MKKYNFDDDSNKFLLQFMIAISLLIFVSIFVGINDVRTSLHDSRYDTSCLIEKSTDGQIRIEHNEVK